MHNVVISFTENDNTGFDNVVQQLQDNTMKIRDHESGYLLAFLLNSIFADMIETASRVEDNLEDIEDILLNQLDNENKVGTRIQECRRAYLIIRKNTEPLKEEFSKLLKPRKDIISEQAIPVFKNLFDQLEFIILTSENNRDLLSSLVDLYVSNNDLRMNAIMKRLTVVSTLFNPVTFVVGLWGMNFVLMPELNWTYGYVFAWIVLIIIGAGTWLFMKKKNWF